MDVTNDYIENPSFEEYYSCPWGNSFQPNEIWIDSCKGWIAPTYGTSDYFNVCNSNGAVGVPFNWAGNYQPSFQGNAYCGFLAYSTGISWDGLWSEYIQTQLMKTLSANKKYSFSMRISRANDYNFSVQNIGANFSGSNLQNFTSTAPYNFIPTILNHTGFLNDTAGWTLVNGAFTSTGLEKYLTIGWFGDTITSDYYWFIPPDTVPGTGELLYLTETYYFVDSLKLYEWNDSFDNFNFNIFTPNGDGQNDEIDLSIYNLAKSNFKIYDRWGKLVFQSTNTKIKWEGTDNQNQPLDDGTFYFLIDAISSENKPITKKGFITLIH